MPFHLIRADITKLSCDAIVNAANNTLLGGGGVDGAIHRAAGPELLEECRTLHGCKTGEAKITKGYLLPSKYVIHTVGPIWQGGDRGEEVLLRSCYRSSLELADEYACESVAFPLISAGAYGYPVQQVLKIASETIREWLETHEQTVYLVIYDRNAFSAASEHFSDVKAYIDDCYAAAHTNLSEERSRRLRAQGRTACPAACAPAPMSDYGSAKESADPLQEYLRRQDAGFSETLLRLIDERGLKDAECYKRANIDRKLFSKIKSDAAYRPSKPTVLAFAIALHLSLPETEDLLKKAGFALSHSSKFDLIAEYFIRNGVYDLFYINEALFAFDQPLLGG